MSLPNLSKPFSLRAITQDRQLAQYSSKTADQLGYKRPNGLPNNPTREVTSQKIPEMESVRDAVWKAALQECSEFGFLTCTMTYQQQVI